MGERAFRCLESSSTIARRVVLLLSMAAAPCFTQEVGGKKLPLVWVLAMGGTIAGRGASPTDLSNYKSGALSAEEIVRSVPQLERLANVKVEQIVNVASPRYHARQLAHARQPHQ